MALFVKPQKPVQCFAGPSNPRVARITGMDMLLNDLKKPIHEIVFPKKVQEPLSARVAESKPADYIAHQPRAPLSARDGNAASIRASKVTPVQSSSQPSTAAHSTVASPTTLAMTPIVALEKYRDSLSLYEKTEIVDFAEVYFVGENARKVCAPVSRGANSGYDDDKGDYRVVKDDHIGYRFQILQELGRGSFGQVMKALDHKTGNHVAVKIIKNKRKFHDQALVEVKILKHLRDRDPSDKSHVVRLVDSFIFRQHMVIIFDLHGMNLYEVCKVNRFAPMSSAMLRSVARQLLETLAFTHKERIVHCDLKPENILLKANSRSEIKVIDFGSSCFESEKLYTYIQSRFYRAPEIMLGIPYTTLIDMWSLGCILAEFANGFPIFPGENEVEQMLALQETLGPVPRSMIERAPRKKHFFDANGAPRLVANSRGKVRKPSSKSLVAFLRTDDKVFLDFIERCLHYEPEKRLTPSEALKHPWIRGAEEEQPPSARRPVEAGHLPSISRR